MLYKKKFYENLNTVDYETLSPSRFGLFPPHRARLA